jgi:hypothetical protein
MSAGRALLFRVVERGDVLLENFAARDHGLPRRRLADIAPDKPGPRLRLRLGLWPDGA